MSNNTEVVIARFPYLADEYQLRKIGMTIEEVHTAVAMFDAVCGVESISAGDLFTDCDGDLCIMHGPGLRLAVQLCTPTFYEDGRRASESTRADYVFGIVYSLLYKGEWSLCHWSPKHSEAQLAAEWRKVYL